MKSFTLALALVSLVQLSSCSSTPKTDGAAESSKSGDSFPHAQFWNCVVKARGKTFYGRAGNAIEARTQAQNECAAKIQRRECDPILCEMKEAAAH